MPRLLVLLAPCLAAGMLPTECRALDPMHRVPDTRLERSEPDVTGWWRASEGHDLMIEDFAPDPGQIELAHPTHIGFFAGLEVITELGRSKLQYRELGSDAPWQASPISLSFPHSTAFSPILGRILAADTGNHRLVTFADIASGEITATYAIAGVPLTSPHDVLHDPENGWLYVLNPNEPTLFRFRDLGVDESALDLSADAAYSRSLSLVDGRVLVIASSKGRVLEIEDMDTGRYTVYRSYGKIRDAPAGAWDATGFVLNDVERYQGMWYASNFFAPPWAEGHDPDRFKLVRFRTWEDFEQGTWEELSPLLPHAVVAYSFTVHRGSLYLAAFNTLFRDDHIYRITQGLFIDGFEPGDVSAWAGE